MNFSEEEIRAMFRAYVELESVRNPSDEFKNMRRDLLWTLEESGCEIYGETTSRSVCKFNGKIFR